MPPAVNTAERKYPRCAIQGLWYDGDSPDKTDLRQDGETIDKDPSAIYVGIAALTNTVLRLVGISNMSRFPVSANETINCYRRLYCRCRHDW